ncbi:MAG: hypothetical protein QOJ46_1072, partial [bacterium]
YAGRHAPGLITVDAWVSERSLHVVVGDEGGGMVLRPPGPGSGLGLGLPLIARLTRQLVIEESTRGVRLRMSFAIG